MEHWKVIGAFLELKRSITNEYMLTPSGAFAPYGGTYQIILLAG